MPADENVDLHLRPAANTTLDRTSHKSKQPRIERDVLAAEGEADDGDEDDSDIDIEPEINDAHSALKLVYKQQRKILRDKLIEASRNRQMNEHYTHEGEDPWNPPDLDQVPLYTEIDIPHEEDTDGSSYLDSDPLDDRSDGDAEAVRYEITQLVDSVPPLLEKYKIVDRLGEGTFSSVYKAVDMCHYIHDNAGWQEGTRTHAPPGKVYVALKRIYVTSSPIRIQNELEILHDLKGSKNVAYLVEALRWEDQVIAVMPFNRHQDFRDWYRVATMPMLRSYFACLFRALSATHRQHIIHRDVKPANFLFDFTQGTGVLCDYGLAQKIAGDEWVDWRSDCLHSLPGPSWGGLKGREWSNKALAQASPDRLPGIHSGLHGVRIPKPLGLFNQYMAIKESQCLAALQLAEGRPLPVEKLKKIHDDFLPLYTMDSDYLEDARKATRDRRSFRKDYRNALEVVAERPAGEKVGYFKEREEKRSHIKANRAGTRGFRAPEVLLKCPDQTVSIDIWSVGIILLCFLTRRFPFFNSNDDTEALAEIATIFGKRRMERCAALHNRTFLSNIPDINNPVHSKLPKLVKSLNPSIFVENSPNPLGPIPSSDESDEEWFVGSELGLAIDLLKRCLELDCTKRWTAEECLEHPFFDSGPYDVGMHQLAPRDERYTPVFPDWQSVPYPVRN